MMMGRTMIAVGGLAGLGMVATALHGWLIGGDADAVRLHMLIALSSVLLLLLAHGWTFLYLARVVPLLHRTAAKVGMMSALDGSLAGSRQRTFPALILATALGFATFLLGASGYSNWSPVWVHVALFFATIAAQIIALATEWHSLEAVERSLGRLKNSLGAGRR